MDESEVLRQWSEDERVATAAIDAGAATICQTLRKSKRPAPPNSPFGSPLVPYSDAAPPAKKPRAGSSSPPASFNLMPKGRLQRASADGDIRPGGVKPGQALETPRRVNKGQALKTPGGVNKGQALKTPNVTYTVEDWKPAGYKAKVGGYQFGGPDHPLGPRATASAAKLVRSGWQQGSGVGKTRPYDWWEFLAVVGPKARKKWVQGHFINRRLGGRGRHENLAPFTYSMNSVHYQQVEKLVLEEYMDAHTKVSYTVRAIKNNPGSINEGNAISWHEDFLANQRTAAVTAMVTWGLVPAADAPGLIKLGPAHPSWNAVTGAARTRIRTYVLQTFPARIVCRARYYGPGSIAKRVGQVIIDNTP